MRRTRFGLVVLAALVIAVPAVAPAAADDGGPAIAKKKKKKMRCTMTGEVQHGQGQSTTRHRVRCMNGRRPVSGASVRGHCEEPVGGARAAAVVTPDDKAKTDKAGVAVLEFTIDSYGPKQVTATITAKGYKAAKVTKTFVVGPGEGELDEAP
jgi:hypothetical protein